METTEKTWVQNREPHILNIGGLKLKPGYPQQVDNIEELKKKYPAFKSKLEKGLIVKLTAKQAESEKGLIDKQINERLKKANMI